MLGKVMHYMLDAILISTVLAGVRRATGLTAKSNSTKNNDVNTFLKSYLDIGEWVFDASVVLLSRSSYFERKR
ncbi:DUF1748-domain-containing protein [Cystobasidium minutum MCA 4210]|uniref:DUF1748-domain-containing protein n=1 Tax=Cystobasidium minutum MCA 4210 TaxID=1397322 RepID=UPI0034CEE34D|eukprot:jgi/Rhomi1/196323/gm1.4537_g